MKRVIALGLLSMSVLTSFSQQTLILNLDDVLRLAESQSLQSLYIKNNYLAGYWGYRSYKANYLPSVNLKSELFSYNKSSNLRYNSQLKTDEFVLTESTSSSAGLSVNQKVGVTGGSFFVKSDLGRIENFGERGFVQFASTPVKVGYSQDLFGFNALKWERKVEPLKYEKSRREYVEAVENLKLKGVNYFFQLALAELKLDIANFNYHTTDTLLQVAKKRYQLGSVTKDELIDLRLNKNNSAISLQEARLSLRWAKEGLLVFLMLPKDTDLEVVLPKAVPTFEVQAEKALKEVMVRNPEYVRQQIAVVRSKENVARATANNRFKAGIDLSYGISKDDGRYDGLNGTALNGSLGNVYQPEFEDHQMVNVGVSIPLLDWGRGKGQCQVAKFQQQTAEISARQVFQEFEQSTITTVLEFNIQKDKVAAAALSDTLAAESYDLTMTRFRKGKVDVLKLVSSQKAKDNAGVKYVSALFEYWQCYYGLRQLTLYDFEKNQPLEADFDALIE